MAGYGTAVSPKALLEAMRDKAEQDTAKLSYIRSVEISTPGLGIIQDEPMIFLVWTGSPETDVGESGAGIVRYATHQVDVYCVIHTATPYREETIVGGGREVGLAQFVADVLDFFGGNALGLSGLHPGWRPTIQLPENGVQLFQVEETGTFVLQAVLSYEARTDFFAR